MKHRNLNDRFVTTVIQHTSSATIVNHNKKLKSVTVQKCPVYISLPYGGKDVSDIFKRRLRLAVKPKFNATQSAIHFP